MPLQNTDAKDGTGCQCPSITWRHKLESFVTDYHKSTDECLEFQRRRILLVLQYQRRFHSSRLDLNQYHSMFRGP